MEHRLPGNRLPPCLGRREVIYPPALVSAPTWCLPQPGVCPNLVFAPTWCLPQPVCLQRLGKRPVLGRRPGPLSCALREKWFTMICMEQAVLRSSPDANDLD
jgi:hypothetical protein